MEINGGLVLMELGKSIFEGVYWLCNSQAH